MRLFTKPRSLDDALLKVIGKKQLTYLKNIIPDQREIVMFAAKEMGMKEHQLMAALADILHLQYLPRLPEYYIDKAAANKLCPRLLSAATAHVVDGEKIVGVACIDPERTRTLLPELADAKMYIASWTEIQRVVNMSAGLGGEELFKQVEDEHVEARESDVGEAVEREVLNQIISNACGIEETIDRICINARGREATYEFSVTGNDNTEEIYRAGIAEEIVEDLAHYLKKQARLSEGKVVPEWQIVELDECKYVLKRETQPEDVEQDDTETYECEEADRDKLEEASEEPKIELEEEAAEITVPKTIRSGDKQIVIIDDDGTFAAIAQHILEDVGYEVSLYPDARRAIADMKDGVILPDLIITDINMPKMSGVDVLLSLLGSENTRDIPKLVTTNDKEDGTYLEALKYGAEHVIFKEQVSGVLAGVVGMVLAGSDERRAAA